MSQTINHFNLLCIVISYLKIRILMKHYCIYVITLSSLHWWSLRWNPGYVIKTFEHQGVVIEYQVSPQGLRQLMFLLNFILANWLLAFGLCRANYQEGLNDSNYHQHHNDIAVMDRFEMPFSRKDIPIPSRQVCRFALAAPLARGKSDSIAGAKQKLV